jgi:hypothetical protein
MLQDKNGNIYDVRNRKERRMHLRFTHHNVFTKQYPSQKSRLRSVSWLREITKPIESIKKEEVQAV